VSAKTPSPTALARRTDGTVRAFWLMCGAAIFFALMNYCARRSADYAHYTQIALYRSGFGALTALAVLGARGTSWRVVDRVGTALRCGIGTTAMGLTFFVLSSRAIPLGAATTIFNLSPVFVALLGPIFLRERASLALAVSLPVSLVGVIMIASAQGMSMPGADLLSRSGSYFPYVLAVLAAILSSGAMLAVRRLGSHEPAEAIAFHFSLFATLIFALAASAFWRSVPWSAMPYLVGTGVTAGIAQVMMTRAYALDTAARVSSYGYVNVAFGAGIGALLLGEQLSVLSLLGMALIVGSGLFTLRGTAPAEQRA
jgi:drug/metabolite transporter (DMT)-like permease